MVWRVWNWLVDWWERPSPLWLQRASIWLFPVTTLLIAFVAGGFNALIGPYTKVSRHLPPDSPDDTIEYAVFRALAGGCIAAGALFFWWNKIRKP